MPSEMPETLTVVIPRKLAEQVDTGKMGPTQRRADEAVLLAVRKALRSTATTEIASDRTGRRKALMLRAEEAIEQAERRLPPRASLSHWGVIETVVDLLAEEDA